MTSLLLGGGAGLLAGLLGGAFGLGGGIVLVPLLAWLLGLSQHDAQGVTLAVMLLPIGLPALLAYLGVVRIRWRLVAALVAGFLGGVSGGALLATGIPERPLRALFAAYLAAMAVQAWRASAPGPGAGAAGALASAWHGLWIGALGGALSGLLGIGGGTIMIPLLVLAVGLDQREAQATSLATMLPPVGLPGVLVYARAEGGLPWLLVAALAAGFGAGGFLGARLAARTSLPRLSRAFSVFMVCVAAALTWQVVAR